MKKQVKIIVSVLAVLVGLTITVFAAYDSSEDPLISFSYLNDIFKKEILGEIDSKIDSRFEELEAAVGEYLENIEIPDSPTTSETTDSAWDIIELGYGDEVYAMASCEIILRSGTAVCIAPDATQGIADLTGSEIFNGESIPLDRLCMIPRGDGRGIKATHASVFVMIRGEYTIVEN